jgi:hypothetical protein
VDKPPHYALIIAKRNCLLKSRRNCFAGSAELGIGTPLWQIVRHGKLGDAQVFTATGAQAALLRSELVPAILANGHSRELKEGLVAQGAAGREQRATQCIHRIFQEV